MRRRAEGGVQALGLGGHDADVRVGDVMTCETVVLPAWATVASLQDRVAARHITYPVVGDDGRAVGVLDLNDLAACADAGDRLIGQVCRPLAEVATAGAEESAAVLPSRCRDGLTLVLAQGRLVGVIRPVCLTRLGHVRHVRHARKARNVP